MEKSGIIPENCDADLENKNVYYTGDYCQCNKSLSSKSNDAVVSQIAIALCCVGNVSI